MLRYLIFDLMLLGDLALLAGAGYLLAVERTPFTVVLVLAAGTVWAEQGGIGLYRPQTVRAFFANAKRLGL